MSDYLYEAFKRLDDLDEDMIELTADGYKKLADILDSEEMSLNVIDPDASEIEEIKDSYLDKIIIDCNVCHSLIYKDAEDIVSSEESEFVNETEECPWCHCIDGYKVVGKVAPFVSEESSVEDDTNKKLTEARKTEVRDLWELVYDDLTDSGTLEINPKTGKPRAKTHAGYSIEAVVPVDDGIRVYAESNDLLDAAKAVAEKHGCEYSFGSEHRGIKINRDKQLPIIAKEYITIKIPELNESLTEAAKPNYYAKVKSETRSTNTLSDFKANVKLMKDVLELDDIEDFYDSFEEQIYDHFLTIEKFIKKNIPNATSWNLNHEDNEVTVITPNGKVKLFIEADDGAGIDVDFLNESLTEADLTAIKGTIANLLKDNMTMLFSIENLLELKAKIVEILDNSDIADKKAVADFKSRLNKLKNKNAVLSLIATYMTGIKANECVDKVNEEFKEIEIKTDETEMSMVAKDDGEVVVTTKPIIAEEAVEEVEAEMIVPVDVAAEDSDETELDIDIEEIDDNFSELAESYLKKIYSNIESFKLKEASTSDCEILLEGIVTFKSGKEKDTAFIFRPDRITKTGKLKLIGENVAITSNKKAFTLTGYMKDSKLMLESFNYKYNERSKANNKSVKLYGTINAADLSK